MDGGLEHRKSSVARTGAEKIHDKEKAALRILDRAEDEYLDLVGELIDANKMLSNALEEASRVDHGSDEGKKLAERIEDLGSLITQMRLLLDDEVDALNEISARHEALKKQMRPHLN